MRARRIPVVVRYVWALPATSVGLLLTGAALCTGASVRCVDGVLEVGGGRLVTATRRLSRSHRFVAITLGHVVIGIHHAALRDARAHERVHVRQYERWGVLFFPLYFASSLVQLLLGRDPYGGNRFEREARAAEAFAERPPRRGSAREWV